MASAGLLPHLRPSFTSPFRSKWLPVTLPHRFCRGNKPSLWGATVTYITLSQQTWETAGGWEKKKLCQGSKGSILKSANPQSLCWCVFCSTFMLPPLSSPVDLVPFWQRGKANKACYHCWHTSNFLIPVRTAPSPSPLPAEITVPVNYYHHGAAHPAEAARAARVFAVNVFWFLRRCTARTLSPYMRGPLLADVFFLLGGHRTIVCLVECERCRYRYIEEIKGCCCKLITGSREPSPGNWEIKFLSLCMHVCVRVHQPTVCRCRFTNRIQLTSAVPLSVRHVFTAQQLHLRHEQWHVKSALCAVCPSRPTSHPLNCRLPPQDACPWYEPRPCGWRLCSWTTKARTTVESSYWMNPRMSCKMEPGFCSLSPVRFKHFREYFYFFFLSDCVVSVWLREDYIFSFVRQTHWSRCKM